WNKGSWHHAVYMEVGLAHLIYCYFDTIIVDNNCRMKYNDKQQVSDFKKRMLLTEHSVSPKRYKIQVHGKVGTQVQSLKCDMHLIRLTGLPYKLEKQILLQILPLLTIHKEGR